MLSHVEIYVSDLPRTKDFWEWLFPQLGYAPFQSWGRGFSWKHGETYIVFVQAEQDGLRIPYNRRNVGLNHLAFMSTKEKIDEISRRAAERGVRILYADRYPHAGGENAYAAYFEDPVRIKVEITAAV